VDGGTIAKVFFAAEGFTPEIVRRSIAMDSKGLSRNRQGMSVHAQLTGAGASGTLRGEMLCRQVSTRLLVPRPAVATGVGIELILTIPR
jgi:hypothetical protein